MIGAFGAGCPPMGDHENLTLVVLIQYGVIDDETLSKEEIMMPDDVQHDIMHINELTFCQNSGYQFLMC